MNQEKTSLEKGGTADGGSGGYQPDASEGGKVKKSEELWLMSFSDMSLVLLCFFVLLITRMQETQQPIETMDELMNGNAGLPTDSDQKKVTDLANRIREIVEKEKLDTTVTVRERGVYIEFSEGMLFRSGSSAINLEFEKTRNQILSVIAKVSGEYDLIVEGHTDDSPMRSPRFPSNWELGAGRGIAVMRTFHKLGVPESRTSVVSYAHTMPRVPYLNLRGRELQAARNRNRRVAVWLRLRDPLDDQTGIPAIVH